MPQPADHTGESAGTNGRAQHYFRGCAALRAGRGVTKKALATESDIDRSTLDKIESGKAPVTEERVMRVFNCLNEKHYGSTLVTKDYVSTVPTARAKG
jgi:transcriptional regulator with XRE-family HTH domain